MKRERSAKINNRLLYVHIIAIMRILIYHSLVIIVYYISDDIFPPSGTTLTRWEGSVPRGYIRDEQFF